MKVGARTIENDARWERVLARDKASDGQFFYSVATTGMFCKPSCASRHLGECRRLLGFVDQLADRHYPIGDPSVRCRLIGLATLTRPKAGGEAILDGLMEPDVFRIGLAGFNSNGRFYEVSAPCWA